ncbi:hypothetical protein PIB30_031990 [Stylosanthes scabra]|uniref:Putative plant transposon protein domain-containing protein n=1 Tax=Stylosanthes scabra TaxID=79078 RepID=A0ABU6QBT4_9FABA|nr:hypothetical protein [Stylosanthes scabra]
MAGLLKKRKGKAVAQSSSEVPKFKTLFHEAHYKSKLSARKVLPELIISFNDEILSECVVQIKARRWEKFTNPIQAVGHHMVKEFYANAWEPVKEKRKPYTYKTMVREKDISFAPSDIKRVLKLKSWYDFVCRSILPTTNRSELTIERAVLIHSIIIGENVNVEEIIADQFYKFVYKTDLSSSLPFPSIIAALCLEAKVVINEDTYIPQEPPIVGEVMTRTKETRARQPRQEAPP